MLYDYEKIDCLLRANLSCNPYTPFGAPPATAPEQGVRVARQVQGAGKSTELRS